MLRFSLSLSRAMDVSNIRFKCYTLLRSIHIGDQQVEAGVAWVYEYLKKMKKIRKDPLKKAI